MTKYLLKGATIATCIQGSKDARVHKADVLIEGNIITRIEENIAPASGVEVIDCHNKWITPGFVDTHRHVFMTVLRANHCDWLLTEYLVKMSWSVQGSLTPEEVGIGQLAGCLDALHNGVTTILDHYHAALTPAHADAALKATVESGARVIWAPARQSQPTEIFPLEFGKEAETAAWQRKKLAEWGSNGGNLRPDGRVTLGLGYDVISNGPVSAHQEFLAYARANNVKIFTAHVVQGPTILRWRDAGVLGPDVVFSHCNVLAERTAPDDEMWKALKDSGAAIGATPEDELGMAHGNPVEHEALKRGVKCGLGIDCTSANSGDIFTQMRTGLQWARAHDHERIRLNKVTPPFHNKYNSVDAFRLGTLGGAEALNLAHLIGSVEVGKRADLVIFDADSVNLGGADDPIAGVVFHASSEDVDTVFVDGEIVKKDGKLVRDWAPVAKELRKMADAIRKRWPADVLEARWKKWYDANGAPDLTSI
ncbi:Metallo-dependent hydrolase [Polyporus arcularius HHB13444]|uniref:Metallo-dependent hydrolase n=1 Tax=Polyporus arcularius HHB13444 TaxID=1314778 RepID=A0A5C3NYP8_9APHY|nr:Metallo-dependent hydrolase [Polyporus arcularius HHB13444]